MYNPGIHFEGKEVAFAGRTWTVEHPIKDAKVIDDKFLLIFEGTFSSCLGQFQNLKAYDLQGNELWTAEHPTSESADRYEKFLDSGESDSLRVLNFASFVCHIDLTTGRLQEAIFTK